MKPISFTSVAVLSTISSVGRISIDTRTLGFTRLKRSRMNGRLWAPKLSLERTRMNPRFRCWKSRRLSSAWFYILKIDSAIP